MADTEDLKYTVTPTTVSHSNLDLSTATMDGLAQRADVRPGSPQQPRGRQRHSRRTIFFINAMPSTFLAQVLAQKLQLNVRFPLNVIM